jgi:deoxyadenosine/deoxycytidine kinase
MKNVIFINGTMGVGKTTVCRELQKTLPNCVFLDGDWCWDSSPFVVTEETKAMVIRNIAYLLNSFLLCSEYENIVFCWVMHQSEIADIICASLTGSFDYHLFTLSCSETSLRDRLLADIKAGKRKPDIVDRSIERIPLYARMPTEKIDVSEITPTQAADLIASNIRAFERKTNNDEKFWTNYR